MRMSSPIRKRIGAWLLLSAMLLSMAPQAGAVDTDNTEASPIAGELLHTDDEEPPGESESTSKETSVPNVPPVQPGDIPDMPSDGTDGGSEEDVEIPLIPIETPSEPVQQFSATVRAALGEGEAYIPQDKMTASASSQADGEGAEKAIDGDSSPASNPAVKTVWCVDWNKENLPPQWFQVDLGKTYTVKAIEMSGRTNAAKAGGFITKFDLEISNDGIAWEKVIEDGAFAAQADDTPVRADLPKEAETRYIRMTAKEIAECTDYPDTAKYFWPAISNFNVIASGLEEEEPPTEGVWSDDWDTPEIPPEAMSVPGVSQSVIPLNTGDGQAWQFLFNAPSGIPKPNAANQDYDFSGVTGWEMIEVPNELSMQGYDILNDTEYYYKTEINIPADYTGKKILLRFNGVYSKIT